MNRSRRIWFSKSLKEDYRRQSAGSEMAKLPLCEMIYAPSRVVKQKMNRLISASPPIRCR